MGYGLFAGFDLNSDRLNVVVISKDGEIIANKTWRYSDVTRPGFPKGKAMALRLNALSESLNFLSRVGVDYVIFEDLFLVKKRKFTRSKSGNRKVSRFAKRQMLIHGVIKALRLCFNVVLVNPKGTTNSEDHDRIMREKGFDRHTASAYLIALKGLEVIKNTNSYVNVLQTRPSTSFLLVVIMLSSVVGLWVGRGICVGIAVRYFLGNASYYHRSRSNSFSVIKLKEEVIIGNLVHSNS